MNDYLTALCSCQGKIAFDSYSVAMKATQRAAKGRNSLKRGVYHCPTCGKYHIGQRPAPTKAKRMLKKRILEQDLT